MKKVLVFFGGDSVEHDVSVITGVLILNSINKKAYLPIPVYVDYDGSWYTGEDLYDVENYKNLNRKNLTRVTLIPPECVLYEIKKEKLKRITEVSVAINCMHGERGEDGSLAGLLNMCKIAFASPDQLSSSVSMNKYTTKIFLKGINVKTLPCVLIKSLKELSAVQNKVTFPVIVKPATLGSSIGIKKASDKQELTEAVNYAFRFSNDVIIERCLTDFTEINCACYLNKNNKACVSECEQPIGTTKILTFEDKYSGGERIFPANIENSVANKIKTITKKIYTALSFTGTVRIDFLVSDNGEIFVNEINAVPGSLAYYLFCDTLKEYSKILTEQLKVAEEHFAKECSTKRRFESSILNITGVKSSKRL